MIGAGGWIVAKAVTPAAMEGQITADNASEIQARIMNKMN